MPLQPRRSHLPGRQDGPVSQVVIYVDSASWHFWAYADGKQSLLNQFRADIKVAGGPGREIVQKCDIVPLDFGYEQVVGLSLGVIVPDSLMRRQILLDGDSTAAKFNVTVSIEKQTQLR